MRCWRSTAALAGGNQAFEGESVLRCAPAADSDRVSVSKVFTVCVTMARKRCIRGLCGVVTAVWAVQSRTGRQWIVSRRLDLSPKRILEVADSKQTSCKSFDGAQQGYVA